jgi:hypothetical protein
MGIIEQRSLSMKDMLDRNVLEAIAHSLEFELYSIESSDGMDTVYGLGWNRLQAITGAATPELEASTVRLAAAGLIHCGGASHSVFDWLLGQRPATFFWATVEGHRWVAGRDAGDGDKTAPSIPPHGQHL